MITAECRYPTVQFMGLGTRLGTYLVCAAYLALLLRHQKASPISRTFQTRIYRLAEGAWIINAMLLVSLFSVGFSNITAVEYLTMAHIFALNAAIMAHGRTIGWTNEPPLNTNEYTLMQAGKEVCMSATYVARTVLAWWFWVSRYDDMLCSDYRYMLGPEEPYVFFFWKVKAFGWFRIVSIVLLGASALHIPCVMVVLEESVASSVYCRSSMVVFVYGILGAELTLRFNMVHGVYHFNFDCVAEVLALLVGCKCFIWGALKPDREADPLVLLNSHASHRVPVSWPYAGVDLQGVFEVLRLAWAGGDRRSGSGSRGDRGSTSAVSRVTLAGNSTANESSSSAVTAQQQLTAIFMVPPPVPSSRPETVSTEMAAVESPPPPHLPPAQPAPPLPPSSSHQPPATASLDVLSPSPSPPQTQQTQSPPRSLLTPPQPYPQPTPELPQQQPLSPPAPPQPPLLQEGPQQHPPDAGNAAGNVAAIG